MASESERGQTVYGNIYGVRTHITTYKVSRIDWEVKPKRVRVP